MKSLESLFASLNAWFKGTEISIFSCKIEQETENKLGSNVKRHKWWFLSSPAISEIPAAEIGQLKVTGKTAAIVY